MSNWLNMTSREKLEVVEGDIERCEKRLETLRLERKQLLEQHNNRAELSLMGQGQG